MKGQSGGRPDRTGYIKKAGNRSFTAPLAPRMIMPRLAGRLSRAHVAVTIRFAQPSEELRLINFKPGDTPSHRSARFRLFSPWELAGAWRRAPSGVGGFHPPTRRCRGASETPGAERMCWTGNY